MKNFKKIAASVAALTAVISLGVETLSATASEINKTIDKALAEKTFVTSYHNDDYEKIAKYLINNGISLNDAKEIMALYIEGDKEDKSINKSVNTKGNGNNTTPKPYYSESSISDEQHYGVIVANRGDVHDDNVFYYLGYEKSDPVVNLQTVSHVNSLNSGVTDIGNFFWDADKYFLSIYANLNMNLPSSNTTCVCDFPITITTNYTTEQEIHDKIELETMTGANCNVPVEYYFETYIRGDVNHDGNVTVRDLTALVNYNLGNGMPANYTGVESNVAAAVNTLSGDMDRNGSTEVNDVVVLQKLLSKLKD